MVFLGWFIGAILFGFVSDKWGRRNALLVAMVFTAVPGVASSFVGIFWLFCLLKVFVGAGIGKLVIKPSYSAMDLKHWTFAKITFDT